MASTKQVKAARNNIKKAQVRWKSMTKAQRARRQPQGKDRTAPGSTGKGDFYRIIVRAKSNFTSFRVQDVGDPGGLERIAGRRRSGSWATHAWLISKKMAHVEDGALIGDSEDVIKLLDSLQSVPVHVKGDIFKARDRRNVPEKEKPTVAQRRAYEENIKKAQMARK